MYSTVSHLHSGAAVREGSEAGWGGSRTREGAVAIAPPHCHQVIFPGMAFVILLLGDLQWVPQIQ